MSNGKSYHSSARKSKGFAKGWHGGREKTRVVLRWTGRTLLVLLAILALFILEENIRGRILLARYKAELRAKGEKLTLEELNLPKVPTEGNGAAELLEAAGQLAPYSKNIGLLGYAFTMKLVAPGRARVLYREAEPAVRTPLFDSWDELSGCIATVSNILDKARAASRKPALAVELDYAKSIRGQSLHSLEVYHLSTWLAAAAIDSLRQGNLDTALENIVAMARLAQVQKNEGVVGVQESRVRTAAYGLQVTWQALQADGWTDQQLARLQECWEGAECLPDIVPSMEEDRVESIRNHHEATLKHLRDSLEWASYYDDELKRGFDYCSSILRLTTHWYLWRAAWRDQDELCILRRWSRTLDAARLVAEQKSWRAWSPAPETPWSSLDHWRYMVSGQLYTGEYAMMRAVKYETLREMTIATIALKRFQLRNGTYPASLSVLVPEFVAELPHDWMDGKPLRYRLNGDGTFTLYSVGENGVDDGGNPDTCPVSWYLDIWGEGDEVWPIAATPEEVDEFYLCGFPRTQQNRISER